MKSKVKIALELIIALCFLGIFLFTLLIIVGRGLFDGIQQEDVIYSFTFIITNPYSLLVICVALGCILIYKRMNFEAPKSVNGPTLTPELPPSAGSKKLKMAAVTLVVLVIGWFTYMFLAHDGLVIAEVKTTLQYLENYYKEHGYYPTKEEFKEANSRSLISVNPNYGYDPHSYDFNQVYYLTYHLNKPREDAPGHPIMDWGYKGQWVSSCDTRNMCDDNELEGNPKGVLWVAKPLATFIAGVTVNPGQAISWTDFDTTDATMNYKWNFSEKQYAGPVQTDFSYDPTLLTEIKPVGPIEGSWYEKGSYFLALRAGETVLKIKISRPFYDTGYEDGTYGGLILMETAHAQEVKIKVIDDLTLLDHGYPWAEQR